jgi:hypothetical protein
MALLDRAEQLFSEALLEAALECGIRGRAPPSPGRSTVEG